MLSSQLTNIIESLVPKLFGFSYALSGDDQSAEDLIVDTYTVFLMKHQAYLSGLEFKKEMKRDRNSLRKFILRELFHEVFTLSCKRVNSFSYEKIGEAEYSNFHNLDLRKKAIFYLKEVEKLSIGDIQEIFIMERYQVIEALNHAENELVCDINVEGHQ